MSPYETILVEQHGGGVVVVTLNRPEALNATDERLHHEVAQVWSYISSLDGARAVVLTGAGKAFSAGGDLALLRRMTDDMSLRTRILEEAGSIVRSLVAFPLPIVAAVNGPAVGFGCSLASLSDLVVMEDHAYFSDPHIAIGLVAGDGGALTWPLNMGLQRTKEWLLLGGRMTAQEALNLGLANRVVETGQSVPVAFALAARLADLPPQALRETRRVLNQPMSARLDDALQDLLDAESASFDESAFQTRLAAMHSKRGS